MEKNKIFKGDEIPEESIVLATKDNLIRIIELKNELHPYLNLIISKNNDKFELRFVYKLLLRIQN